eukprot:611225-Pelagomonas_calceolata.AAC.1
MANQLKFTFTQVNDITAFGEPEQAANLLLPRGAVLLGYSKEVVVLKPRVTALGEVEVPPRTYYRFGGMAGQMRERLPVQQHENFLAAAALSASKSYAHLPMLLRTAHVRKRCCETFSKGRLEIAGEKTHQIDLSLACRYDFNAPNGERVYMSTAAARGKVFVCGGSALLDRWQQQSIGPKLVESVKSFRLKEATPAA